MRNRISGFTLIELVIVIVLLSILAVIALPRFVETDKKAHEAVVGTLGGAFSAAVALLQSQFITNANRNLCNNVVGFGDGTMDVNSSGFAISTTDQVPACTGSTTSAATCLEIYTGLLQQNRPSAGTAGDVDFLVTHAGGVCTYTYQRGGSLSFSYTVSSGAVSVDDTY
ncbi:MAG: prepilin-type N-terminal cleavage/methylation domain-containing protein [Gammaproteobacteria bacterium]|nr:prepilin-type N-terminal cleavage/methylation domain-containing protein [Gammaproteobacteria bacterium]